MNFAERRKLNIICFRRGANIIRKLFGLTVACLLLLGIGSGPQPQESLHTRAQAVVVNAPARSLAFAVLGDIHENIANFQIAVNDLYSINPEMNALILNGDTVDQGLTKQYDSMKMALKKNKAILPPQIIKNIGNHEFFNYEVKVNTAEDVKTFINRYLEFAGEEKVYHDTWLNGYHFISLGSEDGNSETLNNAKAYISQDQQNWLKEKLTENHQKGKPIFVFLHQHLDSNYANGWVGTDQAREITAILSRYQEVILFNSHTHRPPGESSVNFDQAFTTVHTGAVHYTVYFDDKGNRRQEPQIFGIYVEVKGNHVVVRGRDMKQHAWVFTKEIKGKLSI